MKVKKAVSGGGPDGAGVLRADDLQRARVHVRVTVKVLRRELSVAAGLVQSKHVQGLIGLEQTFGASRHWTSGGQDNWG